MGLHEPTSSTQDQDWPMDHACCSGPWRAPSPSSPSADTLYQLNGAYKLAPAMVADQAAYSEPDFLNFSSMSIASPPSEWVDHPDLSYHHQQQERGRPPGPYLYPVDSLASGYGASATETAPYVYQPAEGYLDIDPVSSCPRTYANDVDMALLAKESNLGGYPPHLYLVDPSRHQRLTSLAEGPACDADALVDDMPWAFRSLSLEDVDDVPEKHHDAASSAPDGSSDPSVDYNGLPVPNDPPTQARSPSQSDKPKDDSEPDGKVPYAKLIFKALRSAPGHKMVLKDIYDWFIAHTDKGKNSQKKGWQNSIRHNLSMNGAFRKVEQTSPDDAKKGYIWVLEPSAVTEGVKSTTRYRKTGTSKRYAKSEGFGGRSKQAITKKGGQARKRNRLAKARRSGRATPTMVTPGSPPSPFTVGPPSCSSYPEHVGNEAHLDGAAFLAADRSILPLTPEPLSTKFVDYTSQMYSAPPLPEVVKVEHMNGIADVAGITDDFAAGPFFYDNAAMEHDPKMESVLPLDDVAGTSLHTLGHI